jgi:hypothetical protein
LSLAGFSTKDQILALQAQGASPIELAWILSVAAPSLLEGWKDRPFLRRLEGLTHWARKHLAAPHEVVPWLLCETAIPREIREGNPAALDQWALIPEWLEPHFRAPERLIFRPGSIRKDTDLGRWFEGGRFDLIVEGPQEAFRLPRGMRIVDRLHLTRISDLRKIHVLEFTGLSVELEIAECPNLQAIHGCPGLSWLHIRECHALECLGIESTVLQKIEIEGCAALKDLALPISRTTWSPPDLVIRNCPNLESIGMNLKRPFLVRDLIVEQCPRLKRLPAMLRVRRHTNQSELITLISEGSTDSV